MPSQVQHFSDSWWGEVEGTRWLKAAEKAGRGVTVSLAALSHLTAASVWLVGPTQAQLAWITFA